MVDGLGQWEDGVEGLEEEVGVGAGSADSGAAHRVAAVRGEVGKRSGAGRMDKEKQLNELVGRLKSSAGQNLCAVVLYGSAADHEFHETHSDLNVLCLLERTSWTQLKDLQPVSRWWWRKGHPPPLVFTMDELKHSNGCICRRLNCST